MGEISGEKKGIAELLEKIPVEKRCAITAKILTALFVMRGTKIMPTILGEGEGIIAPVWGLEKHEEITKKIQGESGKKLHLIVQNMFNISVEDATSAAKLAVVAGWFSQGPEFRFEIVEATSERAVVRMPQCGWWERYKEFEMNPELVTCEPTHQAFSEEGLKAINPKLTHKLTKAMPRGDPYCEAVIEFKEE